MVVIHLSFMTRGPPNFLFFENLIFFSPERMKTSMKIKIIDYATSKFVTTVNFDDIKEWSEDRRSYYPQHLLETLKASILNSGIQKPITVIEKDSTFFCVDGLRRLQIAQKLESEGKWTHSDISVNLVPTENIEELYAACAFQKKELSISQKSFFAAKWYYEDIKKLADENKKLSDEGKDVPKKINTSLTAAQLVGIKTPDHIAKAYQLLKYDEWFYECVYQKGFNFIAYDVKELLGYLENDNNKDFALKIIETMKKLAEHDNSTLENKNLYKSARDMVSSNSKTKQKNTSDKLDKTSNDDKLSEGDSNSLSDDSIKNDIGSFVKNFNSAYNDVHNNILIIYTDDMSEDKLGGILKALESTDTIAEAHKVKSLDEISEYVKRGGE